MTKDRRGTAILDRYHRFCLLLDKNFIFDSLSFTINDNYNFYQAYLYILDTLKFSNFLENIDITLKFSKIHNYLIYYLKNIKNWVYYNLKLSVREPFNVYILKGNWVFDILIILSYRYHWFQKLGGVNRRYFLLVFKKGQRIKKINLIIPKTYDTDLRRPPE